MSRFTVQRYCSKNDVNGNPRRVFVIRDEAGVIVATVDEGYEGRYAVRRALDALGVNYLTATNFVDGYSHPDVTDLGDVDVAPGIYRRMKNWKVER